MKKTIYLMLLILGTLVSCEQMLKEESKTSITANYLKTTPDGLDMMITALYASDRSTVAMTEDGTFFTVCYLDCCTDIMLFRAGEAAAYARLVNATASSSYFERVWKHYYSLIGKANEVIHAAEELGLDNNVVKKAWAEAKVFRARSYFELYKRYERLYLNTEPTTVDNIVRTFRPSGKKEIFDVIKDDLDDAIEILAWKDEVGRYNKAVAKHIRAQVAMWDDDYDTAIVHCEDIFNDGTFGLMPRAIDCFNSADLDCKENLFIYPFSTNRGGGYSISSSTGELMGHRMSLVTTPGYKNITGMMWDEAYGGYGWGRVYPNSYLLSLYGEDDNRLTEMFRTKFYYNNPSNLPSGAQLGDEVVPKSGSQYVSNLHPYSLKYFDGGYTNEGYPERTSSFKDIVIYRLAETALMCAEAYYHKEGGSSDKAKEYFNKTYVRAGNAPFDGVLRIQDILDEYARECHLEGVRWPLLKRLRMLDRVAVYGGDLPKDDPMLKDVENLAQQRTNWSEKWYVWPIPQSEIDFMGEANYPQNQGWM